MLNFCESVNLGTWLTDVVPEPPGVNYLQNKIVFIEYWKQVVKHLTTLICHTDKSEQEPHYFKLENELLRRFQNNQLQVTALLPHGT